MLVTSYMWQLNLNKIKMYSTATLVPLLGLDSHIYLAPAILDCAESISIILENLFRQGFML